MSEPTASIEHRPLAVLGWAAFLACSWTWVIGMFLPVILLRDYGVFAWVAFALPNVVGAAAMGWVLYRQGASEELVGRHSQAMTAFSVVTILFHVLVAAWVVRWLGGWAFVAVAGGAALVFLPLLMPRGAALVLSGLTWVFSVAAFVVTVRHTDRITAAAGEASLDLLYLTPAFVIGFLLCPYLDLTFHRARQALSTFGSVAAFTLGFGALFLAMIVFTLWYGPMVIPPDAMRPHVNAQPLRETARLAIVAHIAVQSGFTVAAHGVELLRRFRQPAASAAPAGTGALLGLLFGASIAGAAIYLSEQGFFYQGQSANEIGYRLFMSFYGLIAPAYVWIFLVPFRRSQATAGQRWVTFWVTLILAAPAFWAAFIEDRMVWLLAGLGVLILSRLVLELATRRSPSGAAQPA